MGECFIMRRGGNVLRLPVLNSDYPQDFAVTVNDGQAESAIFEAFIAEAGNPAFYTYQWYLDGVPVDGAVRATFTLENITDAAVRNVYCEISNKAGTIMTRSAILTVSRNDCPVLDSAYPADVTCDAGGSVSFETKIVKHGTSTEYTYQWYLDDEAVESATKSTFKVTNPSLGKHRVYCKVGSSAGTVTSRVAMLNVDTLILYSTRANNNAVTGGWVRRAVEHDGEPVEMYVSMSTANSVDLTNFSKLCFEGEMYVYDEDDHDDGGFYVWRYATNGCLRGVVAHKCTMGGNFTIDVSRLTGKYYIGYFVEYSDSGFVDMKKLYLKV